MTFLRTLLRPLWRRRLVYGAAGALGGYAYYYFIGCSTGSCPLTSNPYIPIAYGMVVGIVMTVGVPQKNS